LSAIVVVSGTFGDECLGDHHSVAMGLDRCRAREREGIAVCPLRTKAGARSPADETPELRPTQQSRSRRPTPSLLRECGRQLADTRLSPSAHEACRGGLLRLARSESVQELVERLSGGLEAPQGPGGGRAGHLLTAQGQRPRSSLVNRAGRRWRSARVLSRGCRRHE
jgi:hypothetical protein